MSCWPIALATPKSITLTTGRPSCSVTSTLVGLRSRWMIPFWWACCTAWQTVREQLQPLAERQAVLVAVLRDRHAADQLHHEVRPARLASRPASSTRAMFGWSISASACRSASKRAMTCAGVHARLDDLQRHLAADRLVLLGHEDHAHAPFADLLQQLVRADLRAGPCSSDWRS